MPRLDDPAEFALIKKIYFPQDWQTLEPIDQEELYDRISHKRLKNQAR